MPHKIKLSANNRVAIKIKLVLLKAPRNPRELYFTLYSIYSFNSLFNHLYTGWPNKNAPSFLARRFLLVIGRNMMVCPQIQYSILSEIYKFRIDRMRTFDLSMN